MKMNLASKLAPYLAAGAVLAAAPSAFAGVPCTATVGYVQLGSGGEVAVQISGSGFAHEIAVCSLTASRAGQVGPITPDTCRAWLTAINSAILSGRPATFWYQNGQTCTTPIYDAWKSTAAGGKGLYTIQF